MTVVAIDGHFSRCTRFAATIANIVIGHWSLVIRQFARIERLGQGGFSYIRMTTKC